MSNLTRHPQRPLPRGHGNPFFEIWRKEPTGIRGNFIAALEEERAEEERITYQEEENVPQRVCVIGAYYKSTFDPVGILH
ncbi:hypothetical protein F4801DRAFT_577880 [Xylaria longipes]|nr:hypothetical protein F4801DRAFT_577880 [Xylaria longipes]RYC59664.1 hypothetical protein CHU98_g6534 [Xylaria longipes]